jgi:hypothetical protein
MHIEVASFVSKRPYSRAVVSARFIAAAVRTIIASATPQAPELRRPSDVAVRLQSDEPATVMRSPFNKDQAYRLRATLREACRHDPSALADAIPRDIGDRVMIPDRIAEAHALLDAVSDPRPATAWFDADPDEQVSLVGYEPPVPRLRARLLPGIAITRSEDGAIILTLRERDLTRQKAGTHRRVHTPV